jgi:hypothetical protein
MNVKSRKIIGLCMSDKLSQELASAALRDAVGRHLAEMSLLFMPFFFNLFDLSMIGSDNVFST